MAKSPEISEIATKLTEQLLSLAGVKAEVACETADDETLKININGDDLGILIGFHGETLKALQILLGVLVNREVKKELKEDIWYRVTVDVAQWRESRQTSLEEMAQRAAIKARETASPVALPPMSPDERRLVHLYLQNEDGISTQSEGDRDERHIVVAPALIKE